MSGSGSGSGSVSGSVSVFIFRLFSLLEQSEKIEMFFYEKGGIVVIHTKKQNAIFNPRKWSQTTQGIHPRNQSFHRNRPLRISRRLEPAEGQCH